MVNEKNVYLVENKKAQIEEVREIENEIPSYEEFMKTYGGSGNLSYDDLSGGDVGEVKGHGPCSSCSGSNRNLAFKLQITLKNCIGDAKGCTIYNTNDAREQAANIKAKAGHWDNFFHSVFSWGERCKLFDRINDEIRRHENGESIDETVSNHDDSDSRRRDEVERRRLQARMEWELAENWQSEWGMTNSYRGRHRGLYD